MAGLSSLTTEKQTQATTMPSWYTGAQENIVNAATAGMQNAPTLAQTTAPVAVGALTGPQSPFKTSEGTLSSIATGAANPWLVSDTGQVSPNVNTALGGLFQAQKDYLSSVLPGVEAGATAGSVGTGQFGSRMNISAFEQAKANALSDLFQKQNQAALQNQQTGVAAGTGLSTTGAQEVKAGLDVADMQQKYPFLSAINYANIINSLKTPTTVTTTKPISPLQQISALYKAIPDSAQVTKFLEGLKIPASLTNLFSTTPSGTTNIPNSTELDNWDLMGNIDNWDLMGTVPTSDSSTGGTYTDNSGLI